MLETLLEARGRILAGLATFAALYLLGRGLGALVRRRYLALERPSFAHVMGRVVALGVALLGLLAGLTVVFPTVEPVDVLGGLGFFSVAVGFAFRDILENLLAGLLLLFRAPFRTHDEVAVGEVRGTVEEINLRETVLRTYDGRRVLIPNSTVYKNPITVQTGYDVVREEAVVGVAYGTDLAQARDLAVQVLRGIEGVRADPAPVALVQDLGASTIDLKMLFWSGSRQSQVLRVRDAALAAVVQAYDDAGIEMPTDILQLESGGTLAQALGEAAERAEAKRAEAAQGRPADPAPERSG